MGIEELGVGAISGIVIGAIVAAGGLVALVVHCWRKREARHNAELQKEKAKGILEKAGFEGTLNSKDQVIAATNEVLIAVADQRDDFERKGEAADRRTIAVTSVIAARRFEAARSYGSISPAVSVKSPILDELSLDAYRAYSAASPGRR